MYYKYIIIILILYIILSYIWYKKPEIFLNCSYSVKSKLKMEDIQGPVLFIATHNDTYIDLITVCGESKKAKNKINILSAKLSMTNPESFLQGLPLFSSYKRLMVYDNKKNNVVEKSIKLLKNKENLLIFLHENNKKSGIYYILKETKVPIVFIRINRENQSINKKNKGDFYNTFGSKINLEYEYYDEYNINIEKEKFINDIDEKLYLKNI